MLQYSKKSKCSASESFPNSLPLFRTRFALALVVVAMVVVGNTDFTVSAQKTEEQCIGANEFWGCQSPTKECQRLCENRGVSKNLVCKQQCEPNCICEAGYLRNGIDGNCVYETECPNKEAKQRQARLNAL